ncbi:hypothetical protein CU044_1708 [Streptomyces sp. L-9-10]|uniref:hypothetical protein n=1 Tax=Streptomyces sp. L-9-10 TaxID=1478131 RepID=UPI00101B9C01|nr:hypothetical protein [Streptomyces sp. L-9-10]RYJ29884.1 hypothetical protein CU044_1708 [Streptomyces sp. L-9-10]
MTRTVTTERAVRELAELDDIEFAVRLLAATPTQEGRDPGLLRQWAYAAEEFGAGLDPARCTARIVERDGGLERGLIARYTSRPPAVELYTDTLAAAEELVDRLGWRDWYPVGSVRAAALAHEAVHQRLHRGPAKAALRRSLGHVVLRLGRRTVYGHVAGADEIAAHAHARAVCGLGRSPLLLTAALAATASPHGAAAAHPHGREK